MKSNSSLIYSLVLVVGDFLALAAAFIGGYAIRGTLSSVPVAHPLGAVTYIEIFLALLPFWIFIFALLGLYSTSIYETRFKEAGKLLIGSFIGLLFVTSYAYADNRTVFPSKLVPVYGFALGFLLLVIFRNLARWARAALFRYDVGITNLLIVGNTDVADELVSGLANSHVSGYRLVGIVGGKGHTAKHFPHLAHFSTFAAAVKALNPHDIHAIVQTELYADSSQNNELLEFAQTHHIAYRFVPGNSELFVGNIAVELFRSSIPVIAVHQTALIGWGRIVKRAYDLVLGTVLFIITLPLMVVLAILAKIAEPRGRVFYSDPRLTRFGNSIKIYKFRSIRRVYSGLTPEEAFTKMGQPELIARYRQNGDYLASDPRIGLFGRFLRRTSLDELPQLLNIVKGDISFVGPRALHPAELAQFDKKDMVLAVKSGLTGLAQVSGRRSISFDERRKLDLYYVQNWSLWLDLTIIIKTVKVVLHRGGAR